MSLQNSYNAGASGYDRVFGPVSREFVPRLVTAARLARGMRVLDVATGTGIAAEIAAEVVGSSGHVVAADISGPMLDRARERLRKVGNVTFALEDGQALTLPDQSFDAVICAMALMLFADQARGVAEFYRVLRSGGWAAASVNTTYDRSFSSRVNVAMGRHVPSMAEAAGRYYSLGDPDHLRRLFEAVGFQDVEITKETRSYRFSSFDVYFEPFDSGVGVGGTEYAALPEEVRRLVREDVRRELGGDPSGGPVEVPVEIMFVSGRR
ncbi:methyltransferase domain-containing protein [Belnapia sp. T6]|uniref:Methyltransferase domain-containing protein n=1 Tax=Belnapia mucosa TaxID=2804532 RepID=A0ABS1VAI6_9PROT|nr:methyltransferase domain-containing protein [Belnapia mucosa]MBL6458686.1 methyltransferase domain-containing protein [Belnapia mucosa]